jgi:hypothetical protein
VPRGTVIAAVLRGTVIAAVLRAGPVGGLPGGTTLAEDARAESMIMVVHHKFTGEKGTARYDC